MEGTRISSEEKSSFGTYLGVGALIVFALIGLYFFVFTQKEKAETTGFDPERPVPEEATIERRLGPSAYAVVRGTKGETPFQNKLYEEQRPGLYVDVITGEPIFSSSDKFNSGLGLPAFTKPISNDLITVSLDTSNNMQRTEVRAKRSNARLGYLFIEPASPTGQIYSIYSVAVNFVPQERMQEQGYESFQHLLEKK